MTKNYINQVLLICFTNAMLRSEILSFKSIGKIVKIDHIQKDCFPMLLAARQVLLSIFHHSLFLPSKYFPSGTPRQRSHFSPEIFYSLIENFNSQSAGLLKNPSRYKISHISSTLDLLHRHRVFPRISKFLILQIFYSTTNDIKGGSLLSQQFIKIIYQSSHVTKSRYHFKKDR